MHRVLRRVRDWQHAWAVHSFCVSEQGCTPTAGHCKIQWSAMGAGAAHGAKKPAQISGRLDAISPNSGRIALYYTLSRSYTKRTEPCRVAQRQKSARPGAGNLFSSR